MYLNYYQTSSFLISIFRDVTLCSLVNGWKHCGGTCCLQLKDKIVGFGPHIDFYRKNTDASSSRGRQLKCEVNLSPLHSAKLKNTWAHISTLPYVLMPYCFLMHNWLYCMLKMVAICSSAVWVPVHQTPRLNVFFH